MPKRKEFSKDRKDAVENSVQRYTIIEDNLNEVSFSETNNDINPFCLIL